MALFRSGLCNEGRVVTLLNRSSKRCPMSEYNLLTKEKPWSSHE